MAESTDQYEFYHYNPNMGAAVVFILFFIATTAMHFFQLVKNRTWYFIPFLIGGFFEAIGYIGRAASANQSPNWTLGPYICQSLLLLLAPALFAASIYMILGRIILLTDGEDHSIIKAKWLTKIFVAGDVLSFLTQSGGGGMLAKAKTEDDKKRGENIIMGGLFIQVIFFGFFIVVSAIFHRRISANPTARCVKLQVPWKKYLFVLYIASGLIMVRSVFRIAEYATGGDGALMQREVYLYLFDSCLMFLTMVLFNFHHPSHVVSRQILADAARDDGLSHQSYLMQNKSTNSAV